jgi:hypothetical protein
MMPSRDLIGATVRVVALFATGAVWLVGGQSAVRSCRRRDYRHQDGCRQTPDDAWIPLCANKLDHLYIS